MAAWEGFSCTWIPVDCETSIPTLRSSPWTRGAPRNGLSRLMRWMRSRTSRDTVGCPFLRRRDFQDHNRRKPLQCQPMTISGLTITTSSPQLGRIRERVTHNSRSADRNNGRGEVRLTVASCWRSAKSSSWRTARPRNVSQNKESMGRKTLAFMARDAIQPRSKIPGFLRPMRFSGATTGRGRQYSEKAVEKRTQSRMHRGPHSALSSISRPNHLSLTPR
jgi:hypothetical protein